MFITFLHILSFLIHFNISSEKTIVDGEIPIVDNSNACESEYASINVTQSLGFIVSPNFDSTGLVTYPENITCSWNLIANNDYKFKIKFLVFDIEKNCFLTSLTFFDGLDDNSLVIEKLCQNQPKNFISPRSILRIKFTSGSRDQNVVPQVGGFKFYFEAIKNNLKCEKNQIVCKDNSKCIKPEKLCDHIFDCSDGTDEEECPIKSDDINFSYECGKLNNSSTYDTSDLTPISILKIIGGNISRPNFWKWQVAFRIISDEPLGHICSGVIINRLWILTSAHCLLTINKEEVTINLAKFHTFLKDPNEFIRYIEEIVFHPDFDISERDNDIALVKLKALLPDNNEYIAPICLPDHPVENLIDNKTLMTIIGWGRSGFFTNSNFLRETQVPLISNEQCSDWLKVLTITSNMICAGYEEGGQDTCNGDSGGPLMHLNTDGKWEVIGITSYGLPCCGCRQNPSIYSNVYNIKKWILEKIDEKSIK